MTDAVPSLLHVSLLSSLHYLLQPPPHPPVPHRHLWRTHTTPQWPPGRHEEVMVVHLDAPVTVISLKANKMSLEQQMPPPSSFPPPSLLRQAITPPK